METNAGVPPGGDNPADFEIPRASQTAAHSKLVFVFPSMRFARFARMSLGSLAPPPPPPGSASDSSSRSRCTDPSAKTNCVPPGCRLEKFHLSLFPRLGLNDEPPVTVHMLDPSFPFTYTPVQIAP